VLAQESQIKLTTYYMKTTLLLLLSTILFCFSSYADDAPTFIKIGSTYVLTGAPGASIPRVVTIAATGGGNWFRVTTPKDNSPGPQKMDDLGDRWINFNQVIEAREAILKKGPK
jgi:hypothetical protein